MGRRGMPQKQMKCNYKETDSYRDKELLADYAGQIFVPGDP